jgi:CubicO group peptidase (beta-lactamase class C family)
MNYYFLILSLLFSFAGTSQNNYRIKNIKADSIIQGQMQRMNIPGVALAVIKNGTVIKQTVYGTGNIEWGNKLTKNSNFQSASCTKLLTSTLYLKAVYDQRINPEQFITEILPSCPLHWKLIQVKHLVNHSSGIRDFKEPGNYQLFDVVNALKDSSLLYPPGSKQQYTQSDFTILAYILETVYHKSFQELLYEKVLNPLHMNDGGFDYEEYSGAITSAKMILNKVETYYENSGMRRYKFKYPHFNYPAGGFFASIKDWTNWAIGLDTHLLFPVAHLNNYNNVTSKLSSTSFTDAGWICMTVNNFQIYGHSGGPALAEVWRFAERGYTFILLTNDGELLPGTALVVASVYIPEFQPDIKISKFER